MQRQPSHHSQFHLASLSLSCLGWMHENSGLRHIQPTDTLCYVINGNEHIVWRMWDFWAVADECESYFFLVRSPPSCSQRARTITHPRILNHTPISLSTPAESEEAKPLSRLASAYQGWRSLASTIPMRSTPSQ